MSEKKSSDEELSDPNFNEDFDFGEGETEVRAAEPTSGSGLNKKILGVMFIVVLGVLGIMGYKVFKSGTSFKTLAAQSTSTIPTPAAENTLTTKTSEHTLANTSSSTTHTATASNPTHSTSTNSPAISQKSSSASEQNFNDIASAFSASEHTASVTPVPDTKTATAEKSPTEMAEQKEGNIQNLKQELFTPEKVSSSNTNGTAQNTTQGSTPKSATTDTPQNANAPTHQEVVQLSDGLNKLNHQIDYILNQIKYLDSYSREVSDNLNKLNDSISAMDNRISTLTNTTSTLSKDMGNVRSEVGHFKQVLKEDGLDTTLRPNTQKRKPSSQPEGKIIIEEPEYTVHAVIPGRAWLKSSSGQIITVAEGDTIGNYGKILVIDAANGVVLTSSGIAFR